MMKNLLGAIALFFCFELSAATGWSSPEVVFSAASTTPFIATDLQGNSVAIWYDNPNNLGHSTLYGATLAYNAYNPSGQPAWILTDPIAVDVSIPNSLVTQGMPLAVDGSGNAFATWVDDNNNILFSRLLFGQTAWSEPAPINVPIKNETVGNPTIAVSPTGNAIVVWTSSFDQLKYKLFSNSFNSVTGSWSGQQQPTSATFSSEINQVAVDSIGNGVVTLSQSSTDIAALSFDFVLNNWSTISPIPTAGNPASALAIDPSGNGTLISIAADGSVIAALLPFQSPAFINQETLSTSGSSAFSSPVIQFDQNGNALAVWVEASGAIASAKYSSLTASWSLFDQIELPIATPANLDLAMDAKGNALLAWTLTTTSSTTGPIQAAVLAANRVVWQLISSISSGLNNEKTPQVVITVIGEGVAVWESVVGNNQGGNIETSIFPGLFALPEDLVPLNFSGQVLQSRTLTTSDRTHRLTWTGNQNATIGSYILVRNGIILATVDPSYQFYIVDDPNRSADVTDNYTLFSLTVTNVPSVPLSLSLP